MNICIKQNTKSDDLLHVTDKALKSIRCLPNVSRLWRAPRQTFLIRDLKQTGATAERPLTSIALKLNGDLNVTASSRPPRQFVLGPYLEA